MYNNLFSIGPLTVHGYGAMIAIGALSAILIAAYRTKKNGLDGDLTFDTAVFGLIAGLIGAKLTFVLSNFKDFIKDPLDVLSDEGFVVIGGLIIGMAVGYLKLKKAKVKVSEYLDIIIPEIAFAQSFGRIGCFLAGCCYGAKTDSFIGVEFPIDSLAPYGISLLPTQLFSAAGDMLIFAILLIIGRRMHANGTIAGAYLVLYGIGRFIIEFFRGDLRTHVGLITTNQFVCLFFVAAGVALISYLTAKKPFGERTLK